MMDAECFSFIHSAGLTHIDDVNDNCQHRFKKKNLSLALSQQSSQPEKTENGNGDYGLRW